MGTTSPKGFRYPEPTTEARTLHTTIKDLADDVTDVFIEHDDRLDVMDTSLGGKGVPIGRVGYRAGTLTNSPNDWIERTIHQATYVILIPNNAVTAHVSMSASATCAGNAAVYWKPLVSINNTGSWTQLSSPDLLSHNQGQPALDIGFEVSGVVNVVAGRGNYIALAVNSYVDSGSAGWVYSGYLQYTVTLLS